MVAERIFLNSSQASQNSRFSSLNSVFRKAWKAATPSGVGGREGETGQTEGQKGIKEEKTAIVVNGSIFGMQFSRTRTCLCILNRGWHTRGSLLLLLLLLCCPRFSPPQAGPQAHECTRATHRHTRQGPTHFYCPAASRTTLSIPAHLLRSFCYIKKKKKKKAKILIFLKKEQQTSA